MAKTPLIIIGAGFVGLECAHQAHQQGWPVAITNRKIGAPKPFQHFLFDGETLSEDLRTYINTANLVMCAPPVAGHDPLAALLKAKNCAPRRAIYLSTTGPYGNRDGGWAFEWQPDTPNSARARARIQAETQWREIMGEDNLLIFRLPGIYGPGRSAINQILEGRHQIPYQPGHVFSRIHRDDVVAAILSAVSRPNAHGVVNLCDDLPASNADVLTYAAKLLGHAPPKRVPMEEAQLSEMARSFYQDNKRISNARAKAMLGWQPAYPTYQMGLDAIHHLMNTDA